MILLFFPWTLSAQEYHLEIAGSSNDLKQIHRYRIKTETNDSLVLLSQLDELRATLQHEGYLDLSIQSVWRDSTNLMATVTLGNRYQWGVLNPGNVDPILLRKIGYRERLFTEKPFQYAEVQALQNKLVQYSANAGYPFASVKLDSIVVNQGRIKAALNLETGPLITFDSISVKVPIKVNTRFLQTYLRIPLGSPFSDQLVSEIPLRIDALTYLKLSGDPQLSFQNDQATTYLPLHYVKSNQIDGVIGFLPNAQSDGGLLLTGQFNLLLENMFGSGRRLRFQWEGFKPESQQLNINFFQPLLLRSPIDLDLSFSLFKEDSSFINRNFNLDLVYAYNSRHYLGMHSNFKSTRLPSSTLFEDASTFPDLADFNLNQFGVTYRFHNLNSLINPKSGFQINLSTATGLKKIKRNSAINDSLYNEINLETNQFSWEAKLEKYLPASKHWVIAIKWHGGGVYNQRLFFNDLYRLGGLKSIRGFSENTFFAENFAYSSIEPRFFFETNSYLFVFYDQAWWLSYNLENNSFKDTPSGFGVGISFTTTAGIFNFAWAVGSSKIQEIGFSQSKIHFGYISRF
ncbi:MAG: membrane protein [Cyclobacteriaceae bacterium]|nr:MAG: membrane protein [Cyclobacteriaceae bacterium]